MSQVHMTIGPLLMVKWQNCLTSIHVEIHAWCWQAACCKATSGDGKAAWYMPWLALAELLACGKPPRVLGDTSCMDTLATRPHVIPESAQYENMHCYKLSHAMAVSPGIRQSKRWLCTCVALASSLPIPCRTASRMRGCSSCSTRQG
jgi:hypothetical protein